MKVNGKSKTPITAAQSEENSGEESKAPTRKAGGTKARTSQQASKKKNNGVLSAVLERISDGVLAFDAGMNYTYLNDRAGELLGRSAAELIGKNLREEYPDVARTPFMEACQRALETQSVVWLNEYFPPTDRWLEGRAYPSQDGVSVVFSEGARESYRIMLDNMREAFFLADFLSDETGKPYDIRFVDVNAALAKLIGKTRSEILGHTVRELIPLTPANMASLERIASIGMGAESFSIEHYSQVLQRWLRSHFFSPRPGQVAGRSVDITASKQAEDRVREVSMFPEQNPNPVMRLTQDGSLLYANQSSAPLLETWKRTQNRAASFLKIREQLPEALKTGSNCEIEVENQSRVFTCLLVPFPEQGYVNLYFRDITERKQAEEALRAIVNQSSAGITRSDLEGRLTFVNQAFCDMMGYSEEELTGMSIWDVTDQAVLEKNQRLYEQVHTRGEGYQLEKRLTRRDGSTLWVSVATSPLRDVDGQIQGATGVVVDITRRKRAEESLLDSARRSLFLSSLSDTIRSLENPSKIQVESSCLLGAHIKASRVAYVEMEADGRFFMQDQYVDDVLEASGWFSMEDLIPRDELSKFQAGRLFTLTDVQSDSRFSDSQRTVYETLSVRSQMILPFTRGEKVVAALLVQQSTPRDWKDEEMSLLKEGAERMQTAIERAQAEQKLRDSEERYRILSNTVPSIVWTSSPDGRITYVNDRWYAYTGLPRQENTFLWSDLVLHPEDVERTFRQLTAMKNSRGEAVIEARIRRHDGEYRWFQTRTLPLMDERGNIAAWHGVTTDIQERVEKEAELLEILHHTPFMLTRCTRDLRYRFVSRAYAEMVGHTSEEVAGKSMAEVMGEEGLRTVLPYVERVLQGERVEYESAVPLESGRSPYVHVTYTPDRDEQGNVTGWFASIVDISERRQMEEHLRESEHKFNIIFHRLPFTAILLRPNDNTIMDVNEEFEAVFGYTRQEAIGRTTFDLGISSTPEERAHILAELQASVAVRDMELELQTKASGPRLFLINTDTVNIAGSEYILQTAQDITERKQAEQALARERNLLDKLFASIPVMMTIYDPVAGQRVNQHFERLTGWSNKGLTARSLVESCYPDPEYRKEVIQRMSASAENEWVDVRMWTRDGRTIDTTWAKLTFPDGMHVGLGIDITERKRMEEQLRRSADFNAYRVRLADSLRPLTDPVQIQAEATRLLGERLGVERVLFAEIDEESQTSFIADNYVNGVPKYVGRHPLNNFDRTNEIHCRGEYHIVTDAATSPSLSDKDRESYARLGIVSSMSIPLIKDGRWVASLGVHHVSARAWTEQEIAYLEETAERTWQHVERARVQQALRASEEKFRRIVETANEGIWEIDRDARTVFINKRMAEMLGYGPEEIIGRSAFEFVYPEDQLDGEKRLEQAKNGAGVRSNEFRFRRKNGSALWTLVSSSPQLDEQGNFLGSISMTMDITERKQAEQELAEFARQQQSLYRLADELSNAGSLEEIFNPALEAIQNALQCDRASILLFDNEDVMRFVAWRGLSDAYRRATDGHSPWKAGDKDPAPISMDDVATAVLSDSLRATIQAEGIGALAFIPLISNDQLIGKFMVYFNTPHSFGKSEIGLAQTIAHQLASHIERKRAEEELRRSKQRLSLTYHHAPLGIVETSMEGKFLEVNEEMCRMLGYPYEEMIHLGIKDVTHKDDLQADLGLYQQMLSGEIPYYRMEKRFVRKDGSVFWGEVVRTLARDEQGKALYAIGGILDISERKQREEELRARTEEIETLMEVSPIGIFVAYDPECTRITGNPAGYRLVEMQEDSSGNISKSAPEDETPTYQTFRNGIELKAEELPMQVAARLGTEVEEQSLELRFENGSRKYIYAYAKPLFDSQGRVRGAIASMLDITQRMEREEELRARTEEIETLMEVSPIGIMVAHDPECNHITGNPAANIILGVPETSEENLSNPALAKRGTAHWVYRNGVELAVPDLPMQMAARMGVEVKDETLEMRFEDGTQKFIYLYAKPLFDARGRSRGAIAALLDVTERRRNEQALRESEERFARFMEHLPGHAWIKDLQGRYVFANAAVQKTYGISPEDLYGKTDREAFTEEMAAEFKITDNMALAEQKGTQYVEKSLREDGSVRHSLITKFTIPGPDGRPALIGGTALDITERVEMEDALRVAHAQAEKTAYRMTQLQKLTATLSQVLTPLQVAQLVVEKGAKVLGAAGSTVMLLNEGTQTLEILYSSLPQGIQQSFTRFPLSLKVPHTDAIRLRQPIWLASREEYLERYPHLSDMIQQWGYQAAVVAPMEYKGRILGGLSMSFDRTLPHSAEDQEYLLTLARQAAQAVERARVETVLRLDAALMENVSAGIYLVSAADGTILHTNPKLDTLFGYEPGEIIGKPVSVLNASNGQSSQEVADEIISILKKTGSWQGEVLSIRKDGTSFWCSTTVTTFEHDTYGTVWVAARQDITERKQMEEALRDSEQRYRAIVSQATTGIVRKDESGRLLFVNQAFCDMLGMTETELKGRRIWELTHADDVGVNKRLFDRLMDEGIPFQLEKRLIHRNGSTLWVNVSVSPVMDAAGKTNSAVSVYIDVTRRRQAEQRLALLSEVSELTRQYDEPDELLYAISKVVGEHFQVRRSLFNEIDLDNDLEIVHQDYCRGVESVAGVHKISDYSSATTAEIMAGKTIVNHDSMLDPRTAADYERSYIENGERAYVAVPLLREDRWVASLWVSDDQPREWDEDDVNLLEAIAERAWTAAEKLRIDKALRDSEERLRVTFNTTAVGFATLTPETYFVDVNEAFCRIVGYSREELLKMNCDRLTHPNFLEETRRHVAQLLAGEIPYFTVEKIYIRGDGDEIWVQDSVSIVRDESGNPLHLITICQDITDRKRSERALQESNQRYQTLVEVSPYAILVNKDERIVFVNNECVKLLGASSPEQILGKSNFDILHPDYHAIVQERIQHMMETHQNVPSLEEKIVRLDGQIVDVEINASPFIEQGEPAILVTMNDITERKRAEEALHQLNLELEERVRRRTIELQVANEFLRESEATSRLILESMPDAIVIIDREGKIVHANTQVETLFGYAPQEVMGQPVEALVPQRKQDQHKQQRTSFDEMRTRRIMGLGQDLYGRRKDENEFPVEVMLAPIDNSTNWDVLVAIRDNTKQRQAQEALRNNEEKLRTLFEILPVGISFLDKDGKISELNTALTEILGLSKKELITGNYKARRYIRADGTPMPASEFASTRARLEKKTVYNVETGVVKENGDLIWTSVNAAPVKVADVEAVVVTIDITERKQAEEALHKHRERLKLLSRRLVEVQEEERHAIARELHDRVGQNLAALTLNLNILRNQLSGEVLEKIGTRLNDSVTLVKDILTITRSVMADLRPNVLDDYGLDAAINEYADRFTQRYGIRVVTHTPVKPTPRLDPGVEMTLLRIAQEALTNIAKHSQATQATITLELENDAVLMAVEDNGLGILSWQKVNQPGSHGLRIMRERAEAFGGYLKIHSTYKNGTTIEVKIPLGNSTPKTGSKEKRS